MSPIDERLNPAQRATLAQLGAGDPAARNEFPADLAASLRERIEADLSGWVDDIDPTRPRIITKHLLAGVHGCQARFLHEQSQPFVPTVPTVRGTIAHKALELAVHWPGTPLPLELVDAAIDRVGDADHWAAEFVGDADPAVRAELRGAAAEIVNKFFETWPPLTAAMRPTTEAKLWAELCDGRIVCKGQVDLTLGQPLGSGAQARKIVVDYKTGNRSPDHRADLRFYALVETLRLGVPPRLLVTSYLNSASLEVEEVTVDILFAAAARLTAGVRAHCALVDGSVEPARRPSGLCRWCDLLDGCDPGQEFLAEAEG